jgi:hypothetical protein
MRSAWSPTRSMSFDTFLEVWPNCLLALPTVLATDFTSRSIERGTGTPRMVLRRIRPLSTRPPASPTAAAPTATAGPLALPAVSLIVPTTPVPFWLALLRLCVLGLVALPPERDEPLLEREPALRLRVEAADFERAADGLDRDEAGLAFARDAAGLAFARDAAGFALDAPLLALVLAPDPFDVELVLLFVLREAGLLVAIPHTLRSGSSAHDMATHVVGA